MTGTRRLLAFALGYFVNDTIATRSDWLSHPQARVVGVCETTSLHSGARR